MFSTHHTMYFLSFLCYLTSVTFNEKCSHKNILSILASLIINKTIIEIWNVSITYFTITYYKKLKNIINLPQFEIWNDLLFLVWRNFYISQYIENKNKYSSLKVYTNAINLFSCYLFIYEKNILIGVISFIMS